MIRRLEAIINLIRMSQTLVDTLLRYDEKKGTWVIEGHIEIQQACIGSIRHSLRILNEK